MQLSVPTAHAITVRPKRNVRFRVIAFLALLALACGASRVLAQGTRAQSQAPSEAAALARGWALLAGGDATAAAKLLPNLMARYPSSASVLMLAVNVEIDRVGALGSLDVYERWLGSRTLDDGYALRRVARALLRETARSDSDRALRLQAITMLIADGDTDAAALLPSSDFPPAAETAVRASTGDQQAVNALIEQVEQPGPSRRIAVGALARSRSPRAIQPLTQVLNDNDPLVRAAAAEALGALAATSAIPQLQSLLNDPVFNVHLAAATALLSLKDTSGLAWLRQLRASEHAGIRLAAVRATSSEPDSEWLSVARSLTTDGDPDIRRQAAELLAPHDPDLARATLEPLLTDANPAQRQASADSYVQNVTRDFGVLRGYLRGADSGTRLRAAERILGLTR